MTKRPRPPVRRNITYAFKLRAPSADLGVHMTIAHYDDGQLMEVFIDVKHTEGSTIRALTGAIARLVSTALQHGVPVEDLLDQFIGTSFAPSGLGAGHPAIQDKMCTSLLDACGRILKMELVKSDERA